ncbi:Hypothetical predicted protein, partial [Pelobates cultripes]
MNPNNRREKLSLTTPLRSPGEMASKSARKTKNKTPLMQISALSSPSKCTEDGAGEGHSPISESDRSESSRSDLTSISLTTAVPAVDNTLHKLLDDLKSFIRSDFQKLAAEI